MIVIGVLIGLAVLVIAGEIIGAAIWGYFRGE